jgi:lipopolysaccharide export system permease protein
MYDGVNYTEEPPKNRRDLNNRPFRRDRFKEQIVRVKVNNFEFTRGDENRYRSADKMLSIRQLKAQEDTLGQTYFRQVRAYLAQISINPILSNKVFNLTTDVDSIKRKIESVPDTLINFDSYFNSLDKWKKAEIALMAKDRATNNYRNLNIYKDQLYERKKFINKYAMEVHRKFTLSIAVLVFFFIGAPLGAIIRKGGLGMPVVVSIFLFVLYYIVSMTGEKSAREEVWQMFSGMWFSTFVFLPIGIWLSYKAATDSAIMSSETYSKIFSRFSSLKNIIFRKKGKTERNVA